jgi:hypothetical protein
VQGYHILAMALFTPALLLEPQLLAVSLAVASALLIAIEVARVGGVPFVGARIHAFMTAFIDSRDAGALLVSHFSLLAGARNGASQTAMSVLSALHVAANRLHDFAACAAPLLQP